jgi:transposase
MSDAEWSFFEPFVRASTGRPSDYRRVLDGIFWVTRTGAPWRDLPGTGQVELGLSAIPTLEPVGTMGRAARCAVGQRGRAQNGPDDRQHRDPRPPSGGGRKRGAQDQALGRSRGGFTSKIHARTNGEGLPLGFVITPGEAHDATAYHELMQLDETRPKALLADRGYDSDAIREDCWVHGADPVIPTKINRKVQRPVDPLLYALRNRIERFFN